MMRLDGGPLGDIAPGMFAAWLKDGGECGASAGLRSALTCAPQGPARLFAAGWRPAADLLAELDPGHGERLEDLCGKLGDGRAAVVVTGQQPGFLGGPLYTLYKIATAVALARRRTLSGHPTVPVFWSADDDTDLAEALAAVAWLPGLRGVIRSGGREYLKRLDLRGRMAGTLSSSIMHHPFVREMEGRGVGPEDLPWGELFDHDWPLSHFLAVFWTRLFAADGLIVLSGDDPRLHASAGELSAKLRSRTNELAALVRARGEELERQGGHAQLDERSLRQPWYTSDGTRRQPLSAADPQDPSTLRPGVLMRSAIQDWLLGPVAVVAGPGEFAYMKQLEPIFEAVGVPRCPVVARLAGTIVPPGTSPVEMSPGAVDRESGNLAAAFLEDAEKRLRRLLTEDVGLDEKRSGMLAAGRIRRWRKGLTHMVTAQARVVGATKGPPWLAPLGRTQERSLAVMGALLAWGNPFLDAVESAAAVHLDHGLAGDWRTALFELSAEGDES